MTEPRRLLECMPHATTRRVRGRRFFLKPTPFVRDLTRYCVALCAERYRAGIRVYAYTAQANHTHCNVVDLHQGGKGRSRLPEFKRDLHRNLACGLNAHYREAESVWGPGSYSNTEIHTPTSIERQLIYLWTQPVKDGLCERPEEWPGFTLFPEDFGKIIVARKPRGAYFGTRRPTRAVLGAPPGLPACPEEVSGEGAAGQGGDSLGSASAAPRSRSRLPEIVCFRVGVPPGYEGWDLDELRKHFRELLDAAVEEIHAERRRARLGDYLGIERVLAQSHRESPGPVTSGGPLNPRVACAGAPALLRALLYGFTRWKSAYRQAYVALEAGRRATFPPGTYARRHFPGLLPPPGPRDPPAP